MNDRDEKENAAIMPTAMAAIIPKTILLFSRDILLIDSELSQSVHDPLSRFLGISVRFRFPFNRYWDYDADPRRTLTTKNILPGVAVHCRPKFHRPKRITKGIAVSRTR